MSYNFCPRCGGKLRARLLKAGEPERLVCEDCTFIFYQGPKLVAGAIFELDGRIALIQRSIPPSYGKWTFPGGFVEQGEAVEAAAERETMEESGMEVKVTGIVGIYSYPGELPAIAVYAARVVGGELSARDEAMAAQGFYRKEIPWGELAFPSTVQALKDYLARY